MAEARAYSPNYQAVSMLADRALARPEGLTINFEVATYGSIEACAHLARGFQKSFTSLRSRARLTHAKSLGEIGKHQDYVPRVSYARGEYDSLVCQRLPLPNGAGWSVLLCPSNMLLDQFKVTDNATGEPLSDIGQTKEPWLRILDKAIYARETLTPDEFREGQRLNPEMWNPNGTDEWLTIEEVEANFARANGKPPPPKMEGLDHLLPQRGNLFAKRGEEG